jgi:NTP pyrophosphatase (non-canonical NTP hydrolase)
MLWKTDEEVAELLGTDDGHGIVSDEIADVLIYALLFCEAAGVDPAAAIRVKLRKNVEKYPVELARGTATKYDDLDQ